MVKGNLEGTVLGAALTAIVLAEGAGIAYGACTLGGAVAAVLAGAGFALLLLFVAAFCKAAAESDAAAGRF